MKDFEAYLETEKKPAIRDQVKEQKRDFIEEIFDDVSNDYIDALTLGSKEEREKLIKRFKDIEINFWNNIKIKYPSLSPKDILNLKNKVRKEIKRFTSTERDINMIDYIDVFFMSTEYKVNLK